jgi:hypothetical protein
MRNATRERVVRILLAAFANSNLTIDELQEISDDLLGRPEFVLDLRSILQKVVHTLRDSSPKKRAFGNDDDATQQILSIVKRRKLSKEKVSSLLAMVSPDAKYIGRNKGDSVTAMVVNFMLVSSENEKHRFLELLSPTGDSDPYLRGIIGRK